MTVMSFRRALVAGLVALAVSAGCATGAGSMAVDSNGRSTLEGQAFPGVAPDIPDCSDGVYNRAAGLCVSEGAE